MSSWHSNAASVFPVETSLRYIVGPLQIGEGKHLVRAGPIPFAMQHPFGSVC